MGIKTKKKNRAAVALARLAVKATEAKYTPEEQSELRRNAVKTRWQGHEYSQTASAISQRKRRAKLKAKKEVIRVHVTRVDESGVFGHETMHCDPAGCAGDEFYWSTIPIDEVERGNVYILEDGDIYMED